MEVAPFASHPLDRGPSPAPLPGGAGAASTATVLLVARARVGRVIGRAGETIKALQCYTGATIQIDQSCDPTRVVLAGPDGAVRLAAAMTGVSENGGGGARSESWPSLGPPTAPHGAPPPARASSPRDGAG